MIIRTLTNLFRRDHKPRTGPKVDIRLSCTGVDLRGRFVRTDGPGEAA